MSWSDTVVFLGFFCFLGFVGYLAYKGSSK